MSLFSKNRCKVCKEEKAVRECPRTGKMIGWQCCNSMRFDMTCPSACAYFLPPTQSLEFNIKSDSIEEANDLVLRLFDIWTMKIHPEIGDLSPLELSLTEEGRVALEEYFSKIRFLDTLPLNKMRQKLKLPKVELPTINSFESFAVNIMNILLDQDWDTFLKHYYHQEQLQSEENKNLFLKRNKKFTFFKKIKQFSLVSSSLNKENKEALIHFDINKKADITLNVIQVGEEWKLKSRIIGDPQLFYGEDTAIKHIATMFSKNEMEEVFELCYRYSMIYPDSSDIEYYWGLFHSISENIKEAKKHFEISYILDPTFAEPLYNIGFIYQVEKKNDQAREIYHRVLEINPNEVKSINNLAILHIEKQEWKQALEYLEKCIKLNPDYDIAQKNYDIVKRQLKEDGKEV